MSVFRANHNPKNTGFTIIEILVVIAIIGILAGGLIALINPVGQLQRSRDSRRKSDLKQIQTGLELYRSDCGGYPASISSPLTSSNGMFSGAVCSVSGATYIQTIPKDPDGTSYFYVPLGSGYSLYSCAENSNDATPGTQAGLTCPKSFYFVVTNP